MHNTIDKNIACVIFKMIQEVMLEITLEEVLHVRYEWVYDKMLQTNCYRDILLQFSIVTKTFCYDLGLLLRHFVTI